MFEREAGNSAAGRGRGEANFGFVVDARVPERLFPTLADAAFEAPKWWRIARLEVRRRFYQTGLGPWWMVIGNGVFIAAVSYLYSGVMGASQQEYFPYLLTGFLIWTFVSSSLAEGSNVFVEEYPFLSQMRLNSFGLVSKNLYRRLLVFSPNLVLFAPLPFFVGFAPVALLSIIPAIVLILVNSLMQSYWFSIVSSAFRDFPLMIVTLLRFLFFLTPIIWDARTVGDPLRRAVAEFNPLYHVIETVRVPLVDGRVPLGSWAVFAGITFVNAALMLIAFRRAHSRIVYLAA